MPVIYLFVAVMVCATLIQIVEGFLNGTLVKNHIDASESVWLSGYVKVIAHIFSFVFLIVAEIIMGI